MKKNFFIKSSYAVLGCILRTALLLILSYFITKNYLMYATSLTPVRTLINRYIFGWRILLEKKESPVCSSPAPPKKNYFIPFFEMRQFF